MAGELIKAFVPNSKTIGNLVRRGGDALETEVHVFQNENPLLLRFHKESKTSLVLKHKWDLSSLGNSIYISPFDMLEAGDEGELKSIRSMLVELFKTTLSTSNPGTDDLELNLLSDIERRLGLLWLLMHNKVMNEKSHLFMDNPETCLSPRFIKTLVKTLLGLQRIGVQIFITTHSYLVIKELELQSNGTDRIMFHSLFVDKSTGEIAVESAENVLQLNHNPISDAFKYVFESLEDHGLAVELLDVLVDETKFSEQMFEVFDSYEDYIKPLADVILPNLCKEFIGNDYCDIVFETESEEQLVRIFVSKKYPNSFVSYAVYIDPIPLHTLTDIRNYQDEAKVWYDNLLYYANGDKAIVNKIISHLVDFANKKD